MYDGMTLDQKSMMFDALLAAVNTSDTSKKAREFYKAQLQVLDPQRYKLLKQSWGKTYNMDKLADSLREAYKDQSLEY